MPRLAWDIATDRPYGAGVDRGVLYRESIPGVPWSGLLSVKENPIGAEIVTNYFNGEKYRSSEKLEEYGSVIDAVTYPKEFEDILENYNRQITQKPFGFSYRTKSTESPDGYDIHIVYNCFAEPTNRDYISINDSAQLTQFSWSITTVPENFPHHKASSHIIIKSFTAKSAVVETIEDILYGTDWTLPRLPDIPELIAIFESNATLTITDYGDGTWSAEGPDEIVHMLTSDVFEISWISAIYLTADTYIVSSY